MSRHYVFLPQYDKEALSSSANDETFTQNYVISVRDKIRDVLDPGETNTNWQVSDIASWAGGASSTGYLFLIRHMDTGVATGYEWFIYIPGKRTTSTQGRLQDLWTNNTVAAEYFIPGSIGSGLSSALESPGMHFNNTGTTATYDVGWDSDGELSSGDFTASNVNPNSNIDDFFPGTGRLKGVVFESLANPVSEWALVVSHDEPFIATYTTPGGENSVGVLYLSGNLIIPYLASDTQTDAVFMWRIDNTSTNVGSFARNEHYCLDPSGNRVSFTGGSLRFPDVFTENNRINADGEFLWDSATIITSDLFKGYLNSDIVRVVGESNGDGYKLFRTGDGLIFLKIMNELAVAFIEDVPIFPAAVE
jgi:hypothetical protein